jgi:hypothetical protein
MTGDEAEEIAWEASRESGLDDRPKCDPRTMAVSYCLLSLAPWRGTKPRFQDGVIWYDADAPESAQAYYVAHEVGHDLIAWAGYELERAVEERAASRIGCALLLPKRAYRRDLGAHGWDLPALVSMWPLAAPWIHARRIAEVAFGGAVTSRWTVRGCTDRVLSDGLEGIPEKPTAIEGALARSAMEGRPIDVGPRMRAWPVEDGVIVVCGAEELHATLARTSAPPPARVRHSGEG